MFGFYDFKAGIRKGEGHHLPHRRRIVHNQGCSTHRFLQLLAAY